MASNRVSLMKEEPKAPLVHPGEVCYESLPFRLIYISPNLKV